MHTQFLSKVKCIILVLTLSLVLSTPVAAGNSVSPVLDAEDLTFFLPLVMHSGEKVAPRFISSFGGHSQLLHMQQNLVYLGQGSQLLVVDASDPVTPKLRSQVDLPGAPNSLVVAKGYAYVATGYGLALVSATSPDEHILVGTIPIDGQAYHLLVAGDILYLSSSTGLYIYDLADPAHPRLRSKFPGVTKSVFLQGALAYLANDWGFSILDVSDPDQPALLGSYGSDTLRAVGEGYAVLSSDFCFKGYCEAYLDIVDVRDPVSPTLSASYDWIDISDWGIGAVTLEDDWLYVGVDGKLNIFQLVPAGQLNLKSETPVQGGAPSSLYNEGNRMYANSGSLLNVFDIDDTAQPQLLGSYSQEERGFVGMLVDQTRAHLLATDLSGGDSAPIRQGLHIVDLGQPAAPAPLGELWMEPGYTVESLRVQDGLGTAAIVDTNYRYAHTGRALGVYDLNDPRDVSLQSRYDPEMACGLWFSDFSPPFSLVEHTAYVLTTCTGLHVVDLSDPAAPVQLGNYQPVGSEHRVLAQEQTVYLGYELWDEKTFEYTLTLEILNVSDPQNIKVVSRYEPSPNLGNYFYTLALDGERLFLGLEGGMEIIDISQPISPTHLGTYTPASTYGPVTSIAVRGDQVLLGWGDREYGPTSQLELLDIHEPANPVQISVYPTDDTIRTIQIMGMHAYLAASSDGVLVLDIRAADSPSLLSRYPIFAQDVWLADDGYVYIASGDNGGHVFEPIRKAFP